MQPIGSGSGALAIGARRDWVNNSRVDRHIDQRDDALEDLEEFRAFYDRALPQVYSYLINRCGGARALAEDLTQETFEAAVKTIGNRNGTTVSVAWLIGVARHKMLDHYRRTGREDRKLSRFRDLTPQLGELLVWDGEASRDKALAALERLPGSQRSAMVLKYFDDLSVPEIAKAMHKSIHAIESLLARGRESFKRFYLEGEDG
jgi:RNA polymerase sigma-70 factor (ECF subfamily)